MEQNLEQLSLLHATAIERLGLPKNVNNALARTITQRISELRNLLESVYVLEELTPRAFDLIVSFGERLSIHLVAQALVQAGAQAQPVEATRLIVTTDQFGDARPLLEESEAKSKALLGKMLEDNIVPVVTGFIGATTKGVTATLGRGGSDYSATILGYCLEAQ